MARWHLKSPASRLFTQPFNQAKVKENIKSPRHWPLCGAFTGDRWIPPHKWPVTRKMFPFDDIIMTCPYLGRYIFVVACKMLKYIRGSTLVMLYMTHVDKLLIWMLLRQCKWPCTSQLRATQVKLLFHFYIFFSSKMYQIISDVITIANR